MELLSQVTIGFCLATACGCRVFVSLWVLALSSIFGGIALKENWLTNPQTIVILTLGTVVEVMVFYRPRLDNLIDAIALPSAVIGGVVAMVSVTAPQPWRWLGAVGGGGSALIIQSACTLIRADLTSRTGGVNNGLFATIELGSALGIALMVLIEPRITAIGVLVLLGFALRYVYRQIRARYDRKTSQQSVTR